MPPHRDAGAPAAPLTPRTTMPPRREAGVMAPASRFAPHTTKPPDHETGAPAAPLTPRTTMPPRREAGIPAPAGRLDPLLAWADDRLGGPLSVRDLAAHAGVSPRTLARRFAEQLGTSPGAWLLGRRIAVARTLLEDTDLPVEAIAGRVGLASAVNLRRRFRDRLGVTPGAYRRAFRAATCEAARGG
jgi:AraC family transcriptional activator FtrA